MTDRDLFDTAVAATRAAKGGCASDTDPLKLVRGGLQRDQRALPPLDPAAAPVDGRTVADGLVYAAAYARFLHYFNLDDQAQGDWRPFFTRDPAVQLAVASVDDVELYKARVKESFDFLNHRSHAGDAAGLRRHLSYLFAIAASLARQLDRLHRALPADHPFRALLTTVIRGQLAGPLARLIGYAYGDRDLAAAYPAVHPLLERLDPGFALLGALTAPFRQVLDEGFSEVWITAPGATDWPAFAATIAALPEGFGDPTADLFTQANHLSTHNLFSGIFDQLLKAYARITAEARRALEAMLTKSDGHEPHFALFLTFLRLHQYARDEINTLTGRHLDFYYRNVLGLRERPPVPGHAHLTVELARQAASFEVTAGVTFAAGKDGSGNNAFFSADRDFVANRAAVAEMRAVYRFDGEPAGMTAAMNRHVGRVYAAPKINSADGVEAPLPPAAPSWHPFYINTFAGGVLTAVPMPPADLGFAVASHYLFLAGGTRRITLTLHVDQVATADELRDHFACSFTTADGWLTRPPLGFRRTAAGTYTVEIELGGDDPAVTPYRAAVHGYGFDTDLPVVRLQALHTDAPYVYKTLQRAVLRSVVLTVAVTGLKTVALSNDFGPIDPSQPFQPFGPAPKAGSSLTIGSKEVFQKRLASLRVALTWKEAPVPYKNTVSARPAYLQGGVWTVYGAGSVLTTAATWAVEPNADANRAVVDRPEAAADEAYRATARHGYVRYVLDRDFGQDQYVADLQNYLIDKAKVFTPDQPAPAPAGNRPVIPVASGIEVDYTAAQEILLEASPGLRVDAAGIASLQQAYLTSLRQGTAMQTQPSLRRLHLGGRPLTTATGAEAIDATGAAFVGRAARFLHLTPFGWAEQHPALAVAAQGRVYLLPQFVPATPADRRVAQCYLGIRDLKPPQRLALLFQVDDGTADPLVQKPRAGTHLRWSYLRGNEWWDFTADAVDDTTGELLRSGIVTLAVPAEASADNTVLPGGMHWIRFAVDVLPEAVCRLLAVTAQGLRATFADRHNDPAFPATVVAAGTIKALEQPDAAVKAVAQPFASFGGRGLEATPDFRTRVAERLRHKDRAVALWDYERLVLEAFPQIYRVKCLNHTEYEPNDIGSVYRELAPGHVTVVTVPDQRQHNLRNPLKPYTSLGTLDEIAAFLRRRVSCFVQLHVRNPEFEEVRADFKVRLQAGYDEGYYRNKLREEVTRFLSPWAFVEGGSPSFGGKIYKSALINFVEERPYVDYVADFRLYHFAGGTENHIDRNEIEPSKAVSILVSVPAAKHAIAVLHAAEASTETEKCACGS